MKITVGIDHAAFSAMARELSRLSGKEFSHVLRLEAAYCIKRAALQSKVASKASIRRTVQERDSSRIIRTSDGRVLIGRAAKRAIVHSGGQGTGEVISYNMNQATGRVWYIDSTQEGEPKYMVFDAGPSRGHHLPDAVWARYEALAAEFPGAVKALLADITARRGIERLSWLQIADAMRVDLGAVAPAGSLQQDVARAANYRGRTFQNGSAREQTSPTTFTIAVENASPVAQKRAGQTRLDSAVASRLRGFEIAMSKGLLDDLQRRARRWPGIFVAPA